MMDKRLKEIRERLNNIRKGKWSKYGIGALINYGKKYCGMWDADERPDGKTHIVPMYDEDAEFISNAPTDIQFLLDFIEGQQRKLEDRLENQTNACLMCDKMDAAMLESNNNSLKSSIIQKNEVIQSMTNDAKKHQEEIRTLKHKLKISNGIVDKYQKEIIPGFRDRADQAEKRELVLRDFIDTEFCTNFKTLHQKSTICHHPDAGECGKYHECRALDEALKQEVVNG